MGSREEQQTYWAKFQSRLYIRKHECSELPHPCQCAAYQLPLRHRGMQSDLMQHFWHALKTVGLLHCNAIMVLRLHFSVYVCARHQAAQGG